MTTKPHPNSKVTAEFFRGGLAITVEQKCIDQRSGLLTYVNHHNIIAPRRQIDRALQKLGYVRCPD